MFALERKSELAESFPIWIWNVSSTVEAAPFAQIAEPTGRWHHQIMRPLADPGFARTIEGSPDSETELMLVHSDLPAKLDRAIDWADAEVDDQWTARLLVIPRLLMHCLWLSDGEHDRLLVLEAPIGTFAEGSEINAETIVAFVRVLPDDEWPTAVDPPPWPENPSDL